MYLVEIDKATGLVKYEGPYDGIMAIKAFRAVVNEKGLGIECFTAIAMVVDWLSTIRHYSLNDRPKKAMYHVTKKRNAFPWANKLIQDALEKYSELQYNPDLVEKESLDNLLRGKLIEIKENKSPGKTTELFKQLNTIKELIKTWNKDNEDKNPFSEGPVVEGYLLSRLEEKMMDKHSFYNN